MIDSETTDAEFNIEERLKNENGELDMKAMLLAVKAKMDMYRERYVAERTLLRQRDMVLKRFVDGL